MLFYICYFISLNTLLSDHDYDYGFHLYCRFQNYDYDYVFHLVILDYHDSVRLNDYDYYDRFDYVNGYDLIPSYGCVRVLNNGC